MVQIDKRNDGSLLADVVSRADQDTFAELIRRHGPMVLGVCRRQLGDHHDAEDAAQAVFLVLWQKATSLRRRSSVGGWLHQVARNICRNARRAKIVRMKHEREAATGSKATGDPHREDWNRIKDLLDDELDALPEKYRTPLVLFHLEGRSLEETTTLLGMKESTLTTRLHRGREMLRQRLARRGIVISTTALGGFLTANVTAAALPLFFAESTARAAHLYALGQTTAGGLVSAQAVALTKGALDMWNVVKIRTAVSVLIAILVIMGTGSFLIWQAMASSSNGWTGPPVTAGDVGQQNPQPAKKKQAVDLFKKPIDLGKDRILIEQHEFDKLPAKLYALKFYPTRDLLSAKYVYEQRLNNKLDDGHYELVGRVPGLILSGAKLEPISFTRSGTNITARIRHVHPAPEGSFASYAYYFRALLPQPPDKLALPPGTYHVQVLFEDYRKTKDGKVVPITDRKEPAIAPLFCRFTVPADNGKSQVDARTPIEKVEKHIAWGKPDRDGLQVGVVLDPHQNTYKFGEVVRCRFFYRITGTKKLTLHLPKLLEARLTKLHAFDNQGKPIPVATLSEKEPLWIVGAYVVHLGPGGMTEVNGSFLAVGQGMENDALTSVLKAKAGQSCHLYFTLKDYTNRNGPDLDTGSVRFDVAAADGKPGNKK